MEYMEREYGLKLDRRKDAYKIYTCFRGNKLDRY
jgi:hypothetical protein